MNTIVPEYLSLISPDNPLVVDQPMGAHRYGWGWLGPGRPISPVIIGVWFENGCLQQYSDLDGKEYSDVMVLTDFGQRCADGKVKPSELKLPKDIEPAPDLSSPEELAPLVGALLFTPGGTCHLCTKKMDIFGQISHAKSHINKGDPVFIEDIGGKKYAKIRDLSAEISAPTQPLTPTQKKEILDGVWLDKTNPIEPPPPPEAGDWTGRNLFSSSNECRLCRKTVHLFGHCSHAKSHIKAGDPVEIALIKKKNVPQILEAAFLNSKVLSPDAQPSPISVPWRDPAEEAREAIQAASEREMGINALVVLNQSVGLPVDRVVLGATWDSMAEVDRDQVLKTAELLRGE